jgi:hypothetical protein
MTRSVSIELPQDIFEGFIQLAELIQQPVEQLVIQSVLGNLPPLVDIEQADLKLELLALHRLENRELGAIARVDGSQEPLFQGPVVLKQVYAQRILKWRGYDWIAPDQGEKTVSIDNPWTEFIGMFAGDSDFASLVEDLQAERSVGVMDAA